MALIVLALVALLSTSANAVVTFGGATSISAFANAITAKFGKGVTYASVGSGAGITGFFSGAYQVAASDDPLSNTQDSQADSTGGKFTLPLILSNYNFMTKKSSGLLLTAAKIKCAYKAGGCATWGSLKSGLSGAIVPVGRSDSSGTTKLISIWLSISTSGWITPGSGSFCGNSYFKSNIQCGMGSGGVSSILAGNANAIGYIQTGAGLRAGLFESKIKNPAGAFVAPGSSDPAQSIPRTLPASKGNWAAVNLLNKIGKSTYPIASFAYMFVRPKAGSAVREFLLYTMSSSSQNLVNSATFKGTLYRLPGKITLKNNNAIKTIK